MKTEDWQRLDYLAGLLEDAWEKTDNVDLAPLLPSAADPLRLVVLREFVKTDMEIRWRKGCGWTLDDYLRRFPELGATAEFLYEEYRARQRFGDRPPLASYKERFPQLYEELERLVAATPVPTVASATGTRDASIPPPASVKPMPSNHVPSIPGGYVAVRLIGRGGFGEVWEAVAPGGFRAAVKIISRPADHEERQREERSLNVIKGLKHHFLIKTHATYSEEDHLYIVMDLADGSLRERFKQCRKENTTIPLPELLFYLKEAAEALDYMHDKDVLHRDIKPDNILLVDQHVRLADFGLARVQDQILATVSGSGTPAYMAPEVWRGKASPASDLYSLAYAYAELRLGRRPFASTDYAGVMFDHLEHTPDLEPLPGPEKQVLLIALAKEPEKRYPTCMDFMRELELATGESASHPGVGARAGAGPGPECGPKPQKRPSGTIKIVTLPSQPEQSVHVVPPPSAAPANGAGETENLGSLLPHHRPRAEPPAPATPPVTATQVEPPTPPRAKGSGKKRPLGKILGVLSLLVLLLVGAPLVVLGFMWPWPPASTTTPAPVPGSFALVQPPPQTWPAGVKEELTIEVTRDHWDQEIRLTFVAGGLPVTIADAVIAAGQSKVRVPVTIAAVAKQTDGRVIVHAQSGDFEPQQTTVTVRLEPPGPWLPKDFEAAGAKTVIRIGQRDYYREIQSNRKDVPEIVFVLVPHENAGDPAPFYMMRKKASNALYAALNPGAQKSIDDKPAVRMTADQAEAAAQKLGGLLPTKEQLDKAIGFLGNENKIGPIPPSPYGIADLPGKGFEFTRNLDWEEGTDAEAAKVNEKTVPLPNPPTGTLVIIRGQFPRALEPLKFEDLKNQRTDPLRTLTQFYHSPSPLTGFRVVIEPPQPQP